MPGPLRVAVIGPADTVGQATGVAESIPGAGPVRAPLYIPCSHVAVPLSVPDGLPIPCRWSGGRGPHGWGWPVVRWWRRASVCRGRPAHLRRRRLSGRRRRSHLRGQAVFSGGAAGSSSVKLRVWGRVAGAAARQVFGYERMMERHTLEGWVVRDPR